MTSFRGPSKGFLSTDVVCAGKQRYGNREKTEVMFQFQERQKKEFKKKEEERKAQKAKREI
jgi:hypothetical protein